MSIKCVYWLQNRKSSSCGIQSGRALKKEHYTTLFYFSLDSEVVGTKCAGTHAAASVYSAYSNVSSHYIHVLMWPRPSNRILSSGTQRDIRISYAFWQAFTPTFLGYVLTSILSATTSLPIFSDTENLAHVELLY